MKLSKTLAPASAKPHLSLKFNSVRQRLRDSRSTHITMVLSESTDMLVGTPAPSFKLPEPKTGKLVALEDFKGSPALLVMFICNHCPYVVHLRDAIISLAREYAAKGVATVAISSNSAISHPQDGPEAMAADAVKFDYPFPYLYDETQEVAKAYKAVCTPEFYVFDGNCQLSYHGRFDESRPRTEAHVQGKDLRAALDATLEGRPLGPSFPSMGCNIKWHSEQEPEYFEAQIIKK